jgi:hypothetical protein
MPGCTSACRIRRNSGGKGLRPSSMKVLSFRMTCRTWKSFGDPWHNGRPFGRRVSCSISALRLPCSYRSLISRIRLRHVFAGSHPICPSAPIKPPWRWRVCSRICQEEPQPSAEPPSRLRFFRDRLQRCSEPTVHRRRETQGEYRKRWGLRYRRAPMPPWPEPIAAMRGSIAAASLMEPRTHAALQRTEASLLPRAWISGETAFRPSSMRASRAAFCTSSFPWPNSSINLTKSAEAASLFTLGVNSPMFSPYRDRHDLWSIESDKPLSSPTQP